MRKADGIGGPGYDTIGRYLRDVAAIPLLTQDEFVRLGRRAKTGDSEAIRELVRHNLRLVISIAKPYAKYGASLEDLINEGNLGLFRAAEKFDVDRGYRFATYAAWWVRQAILRYVADHARTVRLPTTQTWRLRRLTRVTERLRHVHGREPTADELARHLQTSPGEVVRTANLPRKYIAMDHPLPGDGTNFLPDTLADEDALSPDGAALAILRHEHIETALATLDAREADIVKRYYGFNRRTSQTLAQIGKVYGITRERVRQIRNEAIRRLRESPEAPRLAEYAD